MEEMEQVRASEKGDIGKSEELREEEEIVAINHSGSIASLALLFS